MKMTVNAQHLSQYKAKIGWQDFRKTIIDGFENQDWKLFSDSTVYKSKKSSILQDNFNSLGEKIFSSQDPIETLFGFVERNEYMLGDCHYLTSNLTQCVGYGPAEIIVTPQGNIFADGVPRFVEQGYTPDYGPYKVDGNRYIPWFFMKVNGDSTSEMTTVSKSFVSNYQSLVGNNVGKKPTVDMNASLIALHRVVKRMREERPELVAKTNPVYEVKTTPDGKKYIEKNAEIIKSLNKLLRFMPLEEVGNKTSLRFGIMVRVLSDNEVETTDVVQAAVGIKAAIRLNQNGTISLPTTTSLSLDDDANYEYTGNRIQDAIAVSGLVSTSKIGYHRTRRAIFYDTAVGMPFRFGFRVNTPAASNNILGETENGITYFHLRKNSFNEIMMGDNTDLSNIKYPPTRATPNAYDEYIAVIRAVKQLPEYQGDNWYKFWYHVDLDTGSQTGNSVHSDSKTYRGRGFPALRVLRNTTADISTLTNGEFRNIYDFFRTREQHEAREQELIIRNRRDISSIWFRVSLDSSFDDSKAWMDVPGAIVNYNGRNMATPIYFYPEKTQYRIGTSIIYGASLYRELGQNPRQITGDKHNYTDTTLLRDYYTSLGQQGVNYIDGLSKYIQVTSFIRGMTKFPYSGYRNELRRDRIPFIYENTRGRENVSNPFDKLNILNVEYQTAEETVKETYCIAPYNNSRLFPGRKTYAYLDLYYTEQDGNVSPMEESFNYGPFSTINIRKAFDLIKNHPLYDYVLEEMKRYIRVSSSGGNNNILQVTYSVLNSENFSNFTLNPEIINDLRKMNIFSENLPSDFINLSVCNYIIGLWSHIDLGAVTIREASCYLPKLTNPDGTVILPAEVDGRRILGSLVNVDQSIVQNRLYHYIDRFVGDKSTAINQSLFGIRDYRSENINTPGSAVSLQYDLYMSTTPYPTKQQYRELSARALNRTTYTNLLKKIRECETTIPRRIDTITSIVDIDKYGLSYGNITLERNYAYIGDILDGNHVYARPPKKFPHKTPYAPMMLQELGNELYLRDNNNQILDKYNTKFVVEHVYTEDEINDYDRGGYYLTEEFLLYTAFERRLGPCLQVDLVARNGERRSVLVPMVKLSTPSGTGVFVPYSSHTAMRRIHSPEIERKMMEAIDPPNPQLNGYAVWFKRLNSYFEMSKYKGSASIDMFGLHSTSIRARDGFVNQWFSHVSNSTKIIASPPNNFPDIISAFSRFSVVPHEDPLGVLETTKRTARLYPDSLVGQYTSNTWVLRAIYHAMRNDAEFVKLGALTFDEMARQLDGQYGLALPILGRTGFVFDCRAWIESVIYRLPFDWVEDLTVENLFTNGPHRNVDFFKTEMLDLTQPVYDEYSDGMNIPLLVGNPNYEVKSRGKLKPLTDIFRALIDEFGDYGYKLLYLCLAGGVKNSIPAENRPEGMLFSSLIIEEYYDYLLDEAASSKPFKQDLTEDQLDRFKKIFPRRTTPKITDFISNLLFYMSENPTVAKYYRERNKFEGEFDHMVLCHEDVIPDKLYTSNQVWTLPKNRFLLEPIRYQRGGYSSTTSHVHSAIRLTDQHQSNTIWYKQTDKHIKYGTYSGKTMILESNYSSVTSNTMSGFGDYPNTMKRNMDRDTELSPIFGWYSVSSTNDVVLGKLEMRGKWTKNDAGTFTSTDLYQMFFDFVAVDIPVDILIEEPMDAYIVNRLAYCAKSGSQKLVDEVIDFSPDMIKLVRDEIVRDVNGDVNLGWRERKIYNKYMPMDVLKLVTFIETVAIPNARRIHHQNTGWNRLTETQQYAGIVGFGPTAHIKDRVNFARLTESSALRTKPLVIGLNRALSEVNVRLDVSALKPFNPILDRHRLATDVFLIEYGSQFANGPRTSKLSQYSTWGAYVPANADRAQSKKYTVVNEICYFENGYRRTGTTNGYRAIQTSTEDAPICRVPLDDKLHVELERNYGVHLVCPGDPNNVGLTGVVRTSEWYRTYVEDNVNLKRDPDTNTNIDQSEYGEYKMMYRWYERRKQRKNIPNTFVRYYDLQSGDKLWYGDRYYIHLIGASEIGLEGISIYDILVTDLRYFLPELGNLGNGEALRKRIHSLDIGSSCHSVDQYDITEGFTMSMWSMTKQRLVARYFSRMGFKRYTPDGTDLEMYHPTIDGVRSRVGELFDVVAKTYSKEDWRNRTLTHKKESDTTPWDTLSVGHTGGKQLNSYLGAHNAFRSNNTDSVMYTSVPYHFIGDVPIAVGDYYYDNRMYYSRSRTRSVYHRGTIFNGFRWYGTKVDIQYDADPYDFNDDTVFVWELKNRDFAVNEIKAMEDNRIILSDASVFLRNGDMSTTTSSGNRLSLDTIPFFLLSSYAKMRDMYIVAPPNMKNEYPDAFFSILQIVENVISPLEYGLRKPLDAIRINPKSDPITNAINSSSLVADNLATTGSKIMSHYGFIPVLDAAGGFNTVLNTYVYSSFVTGVSPTNTEYNPSAPNANWYRFGTSSYVVVPSYVPKSYMLSASLSVKKLRELEITTEIKSTLYNNMDLHYGSLRNNYIYNGYDKDRYYTSDSVLKRSVTSHDDSRYSSRDTISIRAKSCVIGQYPRVMPTIESYLSYNRNSALSPNNTISTHNETMDFEPWVYNNPTMYSPPKLSLGYRYKKAEYRIRAQHNRDYNTEFYATATCDMLDNRSPFRIRSIDIGHADAAFSYPDSRMRGNLSAPIMRDSKRSDRYEHGRYGFADIGMMYVGRSPVGSMYHVGPIGGPELFSLSEVDDHLYGKVRVLSLTENNRTIGFPLYRKATDGTRVTNTANSAGTWRPYIEQGIRADNQYNSGIFSEEYSLARFTIREKSKLTKASRHSALVQYDFAMPEYMTCPSGEFVHYGDWFNYYTIAHYQINNGRDVAHARPTFPDMSNRGKWNGSDVNHYIDMFTYVDERYRDQTGIVKYFGDLDRPDTSARAYAVRLQGDPTYDRNWFSNNNTVIRCRDLNITELTGRNYIPVPDNSNFFQRPTYARASNSIGYTDRAYLVIPDWNLHEMTYCSKDDNSINDSTPLRVIEMIDDTALRSYYGGWNRLSDELNLVKLLKRTLTSPNRVENLEHWREHIDKHTYGNLYTPHYPYTLVSDSEVIFLSMRDGTHVTPSSKDIVEIERYFGRNMVNNSIFTVDKARNRFGVYPAVGKKLANVVRHTSRTFLENRYTPYWDYIPLCFTIRGGLFDAVARNMNHYQDVANIRGNKRNASSAEVENLKAMFGTDHDRLPMGTSSDKEKYIDAAIKSGFWSHFIESKYMSKALLNIHRFLAQMEGRVERVPMEMRNTWVRGSNYHINYLTYIAILNCDPTMVAVAADMNPYNTDIIEVELLKYISDRAIEYFGIEIFNNLTISNNRDNSKFIFPRWREYMNYIRVVWDQMKGIHPPFSIDNTPVHSMVNEGIRHYMLSIQSSRPNVDEAMVGEMVVMREAPIRMTVCKLSDRVYFNSAPKSYIRTPNKRDVNELINAFEKQILQHYTVRKIAATSSTKIRHLFGSNNDAIFVHASAYSTIIRLVAALEGSIIQVSRQHIYKTPESQHWAHVSDIPSGVDKLDELSTYNESLFSEFGLIRFMRDDTGIIPPYFVLRNYFKISIGSSYLIRVYFYTESQSVKYKDELLVSNASIMGFNMASIVRTQ